MFIHVACKHVIGGAVAYVSECVLKLLGGRKGVRHSLLEDIKGSAVYVGPGIPLRRGHEVRRRCRQDIPYIGYGAPVDVQRVVEQLILCHKDLVAGLVYMAAADTTAADAAAQ